jgi:hypothetical protein
VAVAFITLKSWRSRLPRSILPRKLIILGLFFINSCAGSVGNFFDARRATLSGQLRAPACQESAGRSREYPERHFLERHFMAFGPHFKQTRSAGISRAQLAQSAQAFRAGLVCRHFETAGRQFKSAGISRTQAS